MSALFAIPKLKRFERCVRWAENSSHVERFEGARRLDQADRDSNPLKVKDNEWRFHLDVVEADVAVLNELLYMCVLCTE